jgi:HAMP domain-containing protein
MTAPIEQMILDAKRLANRLKEKEAFATELCIETERVNYQLESMRQFQDDINALNILARERSNTDMIHTIHQENPQIREIQQENRQLKASIEEHQRAMELIMSKYRQITQKQIEETKLDFEKLLKANEGNDVSF